jgi:hypothetical protein
MKTIFILWNRAGKGKSSTIKELAKLFIAKFSSCEILFSSENFPNTPDIRLVIKIDDKITAFESMGDPNSGLETRLNQISDYNCNIIFVTSRTRGETVQAIHKFSNEKKYEKIWTSTYEVPFDSQQNAANSLNAKHIYELFQSLELI